MLSDNVFKCGRMSQNERVVLVMLMKQFDLLGLFYAGVFHKEGLGAHLYFKPSFFVFTL